jgi:hypothetical protein
MADSGKLGGLIKDDLGIIQSAVTIMVVHDGTPVMETTSFTDGDYAIEGIPPGDYTVTAYLEGHEPYSKSDVTIQADEETTLNITLQRC